MAIRVLIVGAGGHGLVVADILLSRGGSGGGAPAIEPIGFVDDDPRLTGTRVLGLEVIGTCDALDTIVHDAVIIAIGDNARREALWRAIVREDRRAMVACHARASVGADVEIGAGSTISAGVVITPGARIGRGAILNTSCSVDHHTTIGAFAHVGPGAIVGARVTIGDRALIGLGAAVMSGCRIGADTIVGAGAVVTTDLPDGVVAAGVPARITRAAR